MEKLCFKCLRKKPIGEFYKHAQMADGHLNKCKSCTKSDAAAHRQLNLERIRAYDRMRASMPHRMELSAAIAAAAKKAGIYNGEVPLTGPQLLLLLEDIAALAQRSQREPLSLSQLREWFARRLKACGPAGVTDQTALAEDVMRWTEKQHNIESTEGKA